MSATPTPDPTEAVTSLLQSIKVCSDATAGAVIKAMQLAFDDPVDIVQAGGMAATAAQSAAAAKSLTEALCDMRESFGQSAPAAPTV